MIQSTVYRKVEYIHNYTMKQSGYNEEILYNDIMTSEQLRNWSIARMLGYYALGYKSAYCVMDFILTPGTSSFVI